MTMIDDGTKIGKVIARAWTDPEFKERLRLDPKAALSEMAIEFPDHVQVEVVENSENKVYLTLPQSPWGEAVSDDEIEPLVRTQAKSVCSNTYSCCCAHPGIVEEAGALAVS